MKKVLFRLLAVALPMLLLTAVSCKKDENDLVRGTVWYSHTIETDAETGDPYDVITKLEFSKWGQKVTLSITEDGKERLNIKGTYTVASYDFIALQLSHKSTGGNTTYNSFSDKGEGKWQLNYTYQLSGGGTFNYFELFVRGRIPAPEELWVL